MLEAYEAERRPVGLTNREWSGKHTGVRMDIAAAYAENPDADKDPAQRQRLADFVAKAGNLENEAFGLEFAYRYESAPVLAVEAGPPPSQELNTIPANAWPGMRAPHLFCGDGQAIFDKLAGTGFTLLRLSPNADPGPMQEAARAAGVPLSLVEINSSRARYIYGADLALVRPDHHPAWRGNTADASALHAARAVIPS